MILKPAGIRFDYHLFQSHISNWRKHQIEMGILPETSLRQNPMQHFLLYLSDIIGFINKRQIGILIAKTNKIINEQRKCEPI